MCEYLREMEISNLPLEISQANSISEKDGSIGITEIKDSNLHSLSTLNKLI